MYGLKPVPFKLTHYRLFPDPYSLVFYFPITSMGTVMVLGGIQALWSQAW